MKKARFQNVSARKASVSRTINLALTLLSVGLIILGAVGLVVLQPKLRLSQELRQQAATSQGRVRLNTLYEPTTGPGENANLVILANTNNLQVDLIQLVFRVITDVTTDPPLVFVPTSSGLSTLLQEVETTTDGFLVSIVAAPASGSALFSSTSDETIVEIGFVPQQNGSVQIEVDNNNSVAHVAGTGAGIDELYVTPLATYAVIADVGTSPSPTPSPSATVEASASPSPSPSPSATASPLVSASPSPSPSASPGVGGTSTKQCNETCSANSECAVNHRCFEGRCRLASNVTSTSCAGPADAGLQRQCNEYCADSRECASGYSCFYNRCRRPDNPDNTSCQIASNATQQAVAQGCNAGCTSNSQCAVNLRCYNGSCRLATNPSSLSCVAATNGAVSQKYYTSGSKGSSTPTTTKGNVSGGITNPYLVSPTPAATYSPITGVVTSPVPVSSPALGSVKPSATPAPGTNEEMQPTWWETVLSDRNGLISTLALLGGAGLLLVLIIVTAVGLLKKRPSTFTASTATKATATGATGASGNGAGYEQYLKQRINQLQGQPLPATNSMPPMKPVTPTAAPANPAAPAPASVVPPAPKVPEQPITLPTTPMPGYTPSTSMLQAVRSKGIATPGGSTPMAPQAPANPTAPSTTQSGTGTPTQS